MAPVSRSRDRGQLILVAGLTVAVILVMLVLLLNTVIYTENLATRGIDSGAGDALEYRATVVGSVAELIERENEHHDEGYPPSEGVEEGVGEIDGVLSERYLYRGTIAEIRANEVLADETSPRIWQSESKEFTSAEGGSGADWIVISQANTVDRFVITIESIEGWVDENETGNSNERLRVVADDSVWTLEVRANENSEFEVSVNGNSETYDVEALDIDLITGEISYDGNEIDSIEPIPPESDTVRFENGDTTTGTFELHATGTPNESDLTEYDGGSGEGPYYTYPVESVDLTIHYETSELRFVTEETVRAEEP